MSQAQTDINVPLTEHELKTFDQEIASNLELCESAGPDWSILLLRMRHTLRAQSHRIAELEAQLSTAQDKIKHDADVLSLEGFTNVGTAIIEYQHVKTQLSTIAATAAKAMQEEAAALVRRLFQEGHGMEQTPHAIRAINVDALVEKVKE